MLCHRISLRQWGSPLSLAVAATLGITAALAATAVVSAADGDKREGEKQQAGKKSQTTSQGAAQVKAELPPSIEKLDLQPKQEQQIRDIVSKFDSRFQQSWNRFHQLHMQAVQLEGAWTAALEGQMDEKQKQQFRQARRESNQQRKIQLGYRPGDAQSDKSQKEKSPAETKKKQQQPDQPKQQQAGSEQEPDAVIVGIVVASPEPDTTGSNLSQEQKQRCEKICAAYQQEIRSTWRQMRLQHMEMVNIEAEKLAAIEEVLTEEQLKQLKEQQQQPASSAGGSRPAQPEKSAPSRKEKRET